ncbi:MAG: sigma-54-dependent transcriptional regulator [Psychroflexus sp.]
MQKILIVDDDPFFNKTLSNYLKRFSYVVETATSAEMALSQIHEKNYDLILTDYRLPEMNGLDLIAKIKSNSDIPVILITNYSDVRTAVNSIKLGAFEFISKPVIPEELKLVVEKAIHKDKKSQNSSKTFQNEKSNTAFEKSLVKGNTSEAQELWSFAAQVAPTNMSVLITGESGTGKEYVARFIHEHSDRSKQNFVAIDCGALPENIASSELFGHTKGAFTGAELEKKGQFEYADGGTLFLDEIGNLSYDSQVKLLRVLQERKIKRLGANKEIAVDLRIIAATNENLKTAIENGDFRNDLFHRLNEFNLKIPPLRVRDTDFDEFIHFFMNEASNELNKPNVSIDSELISELKKYDWPGNLRELKNLMKRAVLLSSDGKILKQHLPQSIFEIQDNFEHAKVSNLKENQQIHEREIILKCLKKNKYNKSKTAKELNIDRTTLYNKIKTLDLDV